MSIIRRAVNHKAARAASLRKKRLLDGGGGERGGARVQEMGCEGAAPDGEGKRLPPPPWPARPRRFFWVTFSVAWSRLSVLDGLKRGSRGRVAKRGGQPPPESPLLLCQSCPREERRAPDLPAPEGRRWLYSRGEGWGREWTRVSECTYVCGERGGGSRGLAGAGSCSLANGQAPLALVLLPAPPGEGD